MQKVLLLLMLLITQATFAQDYEIVEIGVSDYRESGQLASGEIQVLNFTGTSLNVSCSPNQRSWTSKSLKNRSGIEIHVTSDIDKFYVKYCNANNSSVVCDNYKLTPGRRYVFRYSDKAKKVTLRKTED